MSLVAVALALASCAGGADGGQAGTCTGTFTACGGDPTGSWNLTGMCFENGVVAMVDGLRADQTANCAGAVKAATVTFSGTVSYSGGSVTYDTTTDTSATVSYSGACMADMLGSPAADAGGCATIEGMLKTGGTAGCTFSGSSCDCQLTNHGSRTRSNGYTVSGATITETDGSAYDFCVSGATMSQRSEVSPGNYGVMTLGRQ